MNILLLLLFTVIYALAYRAGGTGKEDEAKPKWIPKWLRKSWVRDWLCPLFVYGSLLLFYQPCLWWEWLLLVLCYPLLGASLSTYWDWLFGFDNYWFAGFVCGIASFPLIFCGFTWWTILLRAILVAVLWGVWSLFWAEDWVEEFGRGAIIVLTTPVFLL